MSTEEILKRLAQYLVYRRRAAGLLASAPGEMGKKGGRYLDMIAEARQCEADAESCLAQLEAHFGL